MTVALALIIGVFLGGLVIAIYAGVLIRDLQRDYAHLSSLHKDSQRRLHDLEKRFYEVD